MAQQQQQARPVARQGSQAPAGALAVQDKPAAKLAPIAVGPAARIASPEQLGAVAEKVLGQGNLADMDRAARARYLLYVCQLLGVNPFTRPFEIISFRDQTVLYARKEATEQLARNFGVTTEVVRRAPDEFLGVYVTEVRASYRTPAGEVRSADAIGAVPYLDAGGKMIPVLERANVVKKSETQGRRRAVLGLLGLGIFDRAGERDPDAVVDRHGNLAQRAPLGELPQSSRTTEEIFGDEPPDTYRGGPTVRAEAARREEILTPTDDEIAAAAAEPIEVVAAPLAGRVDYDGPKVIARGARRSLAVIVPVEVSDAARTAVGSALLRWTDARDGNPPGVPGLGGGEAAWSAWVDQVEAALEGVAEA
jgi:hypothetical protein